MFPQHRGQVVAMAVGVPPDYLAAGVNHEGSADGALPVGGRFRMGAVGPQEPVVSPAAAYVRVTYYRPGVVDPVGHAGVSAEGAQVHQSVPVSQERVMSSPRRSLPPTTSPLRPPVQVQRTNRERTLSLPAGDRLRLQAGSPLRQYNTDRRD